MLSKAIHIAINSLPRLDDWLGSALTGLVSIGLYSLAAVGPLMLAPSVSLVAHTFAIMAIYRLIARTYSRTLRHGIDFIRHRSGLPPSKRGRQ